MMKQKLQLGCGLIRIGRTWGVESNSIPSEIEAREFLEFAFDLGIRFFDTAPSYGTSEKRLGAFLGSLTKHERSRVSIATKFSEHWNESKNEPYVDYSLDALKKSIDRSLALLGNVDLIQLHKATPDFTSDQRILKAFEYASDCGVNNWGVSVSNVESGEAVLTDDRFTLIQLPYNYERMELLPIIDKACAEGRSLLFNRPFAMGSVIVGAVGEKEKTKVIKEAYRMIVDTNASGFVLSGTASKKHLGQNYMLFKKVING